MGFLRQALLVAVTAVVVALLPSYFRKSYPIPEVKGYVAPGFERVKEVFRENFEEGWDKPEGGSAFAVYYRGRKVVDIWAGYADQEGNVPWREDTMTLIFSTSKGLAAICLGMLADRGLLDFTKPVSFYWPEFAQHGKERITVAQLMEHEAGLPILAEKQTWKLLADYDELDKVLAASKPMWEPGTAHGYHAISYGYYANAIMRRVDPKKRTIGQFLQEEIAVPHGIDVHIGTPKELSYRIARPIPVTANVKDLIYGLFNKPLDRQMYMNMFFQSDNILNKVVENLGETGDFSELCDPDKRLLEMPAGNGFGTAEGVAKLYGILANGGTSIENNKTILSKSYLEVYENCPIKLTEDLVINPLKIAWKHGMNVGPSSNPEGGKNVYGHPGAGGQFGLADPNLKIGFGFVTRTAGILVTEDDRFRRVKEATYSAIDALERS